jgi:hypothetical protein
MSKPIVAASLFIGLLAGCTTTSDESFTDASCGKAQVTDKRSLYVCRGSPVNLGTFKKALLRKADPTLDPKEVGLTFGIPPEEISGVVAASSATASAEKPEIVTVNRRTFAVYQRDGATVFVERR